MASSSVSQFGEQVTAHPGYKSELADVARLDEDVGLEINAIIVQPERHLHSLL